MGIENPLQDEELVAGELRQVVPEPEVLVVAIVAGRDAEIPEQGPVHAR